MLDRTCLTCNADIAHCPPQAQYCNAACWLWKPPVPGACAGCGVVLPPKTYQGNPRKWCSESCRMRTKRYGTGILIIKTCLWCDGSFSSRIRTAQYCSKQCGWLHRSAKRQAKVDHVVVLPRTCPECGMVFTPRPNNAAKAVWCSQPCVQRDVGRRRRAREAATSSGPINPQQIYARDMWLCQLCTEPIDQSARAPHPRSKSLDHIIPLSRGGTHTIDNIQTAHFRCNQLKSDHEEAIWRARVERLSLCAPGGMTLLDATPR